MTADLSSDNLRKNLTPAIKRPNLNKMKVQSTINNIRTWGEDKQITGKNGKATGESQFSKTLEEIEELSDAIKAHDLPEIKDAIGDTGVTLILLAERYGLTFEECLEWAYNIIAKRTGKIVDGVFVKDK